MNAQELRIGNYVKLSSESPWAEHHKDVFIVTRIEERADKMFPNATHSVNIFLNKLIKFSQFNFLIDPIPLTPEWLVKFNGYEHDGFWRLPFGGIDLDIKEHVTLWGGYYVEHITTVHQLQNLYFALTGREIEISNLPQN